MHYTDDAIIRAIQDNNENLDECFKYLYKKAYKKAVGYFNKKGLNENETKDLFQDSIIVFYEAVKEDRFVLKAKIETYLFAVMNKMWINKMKIKNPESLVNGELYKEHNVNNVEDFIISEEQKKIVQFFINKLKEDCKRILVYFYYHKLAMHEIAKEMGYKNDQIARNKKVKCMRAFQAIIKNSRFENELK
jgi:RNA polymerase sigma factor (sigma-70 family)